MPIETYKKRFATCLNCMDGRAQLPVIHYIKENYGIDYVDMITEPGMDKVLASENRDINNILLKIETSVEKHNSDILFLVGHYDCAANPVDDESHKENICIGVDRLKKLRPFLQIIGLWVSREWVVEKIIEK